MAITVSIELIATTRCIRCWFASFSSAKHCRVQHIRRYTGRGGRTPGKNELNTNRGRCRTIGQSPGICSRTRTKLDGFKPSSLLQELSLRAAQVRGLRETTDSDLRASSETPIS